MNQNKNYHSNAHLSCEFWHFWTNFFGRCHTWCVIVNCKYNQLQLKKYNLQKSEDLFFIRFSTVRIFHENGRNSEGGGGLQILTGTGPTLLKNAFKFKNESPHMTWPHASSPSLHYAHWNWKSSFVYQFYFVIGSAKSLKGFNE